MNKKLTEILFILDQSSSMDGMAEQVRSSTLKFIEDKVKLADQENIDINFSLIEFATGQKEVFWRRPIRQVQFTRGMYGPSGWTALYDSIGIHCEKLGKELADTLQSERPGKVIVVILTDGQENYSQEFRTKQSIKNLIDRQQNEYNWQFIFLSTNLNSFNDAQHDFNIKKSILFKQNVESYNATYDSLSRGIDDSIKDSLKDDE